MIKDGFLLDESLCGIDLPSPIISNTNTVNISFTSDESETRKGFILLFKSELWNGGKHNDATH